MMKNIKNFLRAFFPFLAVIILWRLTSRIFNPGGILALIPIFYCTFITRTPWFALFGAIFCSLIDYNMNTGLFWTMIYLLFYAINGFTSVIDLSRMDNNAIGIFAIFIGVGLLLLFLYTPTFTNFAFSFLLFVWCMALYIPITRLIDGGA